MVHTATLPAPSRSLLPDWAARSLDRPRGAAARRMPSRPGRRASVAGIAPRDDVLSTTRELLNAWHHDQPAGVTLDDREARWGDLDTRPLQAPGGPDARRPRRAYDHPGATVAGPSPVAGSTPDALPTQGLVAQLLDGFQLWIGEREITDLPRGKPRSLLKFLLLERRRPVSRARLMRLFWPEAEPAAARNALNVTLHRLRKALGEPNVLVYADDAYQLTTPGAIWVDVEQFLLHAESGRHAETTGQASVAIRHYELAAALYCADLTDEQDGDDTLQVQAQALRDRLNQVLDNLAGLHETLGHWHPCLQAALRHLQLDTCNEAAHQRLMRCYARLGQLQLAERQYRGCVQALRASLGLAPSVETTALYRKIAARELPVAAQVG